jgi:hypothetical protein
MFGRAPTGDLESVGKIKFKMVAYFWPRKSNHQLTIFTTHFTTKSPQKYHDLTPNIPKTPAKTPFHHARKKPEPTSETTPSIGREG